MPKDKGYNCLPMATTYSEASDAEIEKAVRKSKDINMMQKKKRYTRTPGPKQLKV